MNIENMSKDEIEKMSHLDILRHVTIHGFVENWYS